VRYTAAALAIAGLALSLLVITVAFPPQVTRAHHIPPEESRSPTVSPIKHIVIIVRENHSFDNIFGTFPGADGTTRARLPNGHIVLLNHSPDHTELDIGHAGDSAALAVDKGRMDRFDQLAGANQGGRDIADSQYYESDIPAY